MTATLSAATVIAAPALAMDARIVRQLEKLDPDTRLEQACDTEAMARIGADATQFRPDKVIAYTFSEPVLEGDSITAPGAVFRSGGDWYRLSFTCTTGPKRIHVRALDYRIGRMVPRSDWQDHYLYD